MNPPVLYILKRYPRLSETFIVREILTLEAAGERVAIDALLPAEPGVSHPEVAQVRATVRYLPSRPHWSDAVVARAHLELLARHPVRWVGTAWQARRDGEQRRFLQAGLVALRIRREGIEHVHAHFATAAADVARYAARLSGSRFSVTAHAKDIFSAEHAPQLATRVAGASTVVTVSGYNAEHLRGALPSATVTMIPTGIEIPERAGGPHPGGPVLCVARLVPKKGLDVLVDAVALLAPELPALRLHLVGGGPLEADLRGRHPWLADRIVFAGAQPSPAVEAAYRECSMFALPCRIAEDGDRDGMPTAILEAMARGIPVISTDVIGIGEIVRDEVTGLLVPPDDVLALAAALRRLWLDPDEAARLGAAGGALVTELRDPGASATALREVFAGVTA